MVYAREPWAEYSGEKGIGGMDCILDGNRFGVGKSFDLQQIARGAFQTSEISRVDKTARGKRL
jgi:hypothetical protein